MVVYVDMLHNGKQVVDAWIYRVNLCLVVTCTVLEYHKLLQHDQLITDVGDFSIKNRRYLQASHIP